ncbi:MAG: hypothetical protein WCT03_04960 [Candidatus Obscuribacterales bacterium]
MKAFFHCISVATMLACAIALPSSGYTLERQNARLFGLAEIKASNGSRTFRIRGMSNGSACVCAKPRTKFRNDVLIVEIPKVIISQGLKTGPFFDVIVRAPDTVKMIVFGKNRAEIWPCDRAKIALTIEEENAQRMAKLDLLEMRPNDDIGDYSVEIITESPTIVSVAFSKWCDGEPGLRLIYRIDTSKKLILKRPAFSK